MTTSEHSRTTRLITSGRDANDNSLAHPVWPSSVWASPDFDTARAKATALRSPEFYGRHANPTVGAFESAIAELEGAEAALAFGSGMGAFASTVLALCSSGSHIVAARQIYSGCLSFLQGPCRRLGIDVTMVDGTAPGAFATAVEPGRTMLVIAETPSNPMTELVDLAEFGKVGGPFTMVDSTFATPLAQRPLEFGVDIVLHSATKGIAGHNDATIGVIASEAELIDTIWSYSIMHGAVASPSDAHSALRGVRTLGVRTAQQAATAHELAAWLESQNEVARVLYPGLASHPQHDIARSQMDTYGTVVAFDLVGGVDAARSLIDRVELIRRATSLGGPETMICHPASTTHAGLTDDERAVTGVTDGLIRMTVGLESPDDLIADLAWR